MDGLEPKTSQQKAQLDIDARLHMLHDMTWMPDHGVTRRATVKAITELMPSLIADMHILDDETDPGLPLPEWMRTQLDVMRKGL